jgi:hypothetical protein
MGDGLPPGRIYEEPNLPFFLAWKQDDWQFDVREKLVPVIVHQHYGPGVGACGSKSKGRETHFAELRSHGFTFIPFDVLGEDYVQAFATRQSKWTENANGKKELTYQHFTTIFMRPVVPADPQEKVEWVADVDTIRLFVDYLRESGHIPPPRPEIVRQLLKVQQQVRAQYVSDLRRPGITTAAQERYESRLAEVDTRLAILDEELQKARAHHGREQDPFDENGPRALVEAARARAQQGNSSTAAPSDAPMSRDATGKPRRPVDPGAVVAKARASRKPPPPAAPVAEAPTAGTDDAGDE